MEIRGKPAARRQAPAASIAASSRAGASRAGRARRRGGTGTAAGCAPVSASGCAVAGGQHGAAPRLRRLGRRDRRLQRGDDAHAEFLGEEVRRVGPHLGVRDRGDAEREGDGDEGVVALGQFAVGQGGGRGRRLAGSRAGLLPGAPRLGSGAGAGGRRALLSRHLDLS